MKKLLLFVVALCFPAIAAVSGLGGSTTTCLDKDSDGYGVGPGCTGVDSDDNDATIHTGAEAIAKYGTLSAFLSHLGYTPLHIWYISTTGNDGTGARDNISLPYRTYTAIKSSVVAGDMVIWRAGTYTGERVDIANSGTSSNPITFIAYPGESVLINAGSLQGAFYFNNRSYLTFDGLRATSTDDIFYAGTYYAPTGTTVNGSNVYDTSQPSLCHHITLRNIEAYGGYRGIILMNGIEDVLIEDSVFRNQLIEHGIYIGSPRGIPDARITIRRNLLYGNAFNGVQINGRVSALTISQNLIYGNGIGLSFLQGVSGATITSNVIFQNDNPAIKFRNYDGDCAAWGTAGNHSLEEGYICPYSQNNNLIENNTLYATGTADNTAIVFDNSSTQNYQLGLTGVQGDLGNNTVRNNVIVGNAIASTGYPPIYYQQNLGYAATSTFDHNLFYYSSGTAGTNVLRIAGVSYTCATAASVSTMTNCSVASPGFTHAVSTDAANLFDFRPAAGSAMIGAGSTTSLPTYDFLGVPRNTTSPVIGAYEYTTITNGSWKMFQTGGVPEGLIGWEKMVYAPSIQKTMMMSYWHDLSTEPNSGFVLYDYRTNRWDLMDVLSLNHTENGPESGHQAGMVGWDSNRGVYTMYCCASNTRQPETVNHTWWMDPNGLTGLDKFNFSSNGTTPSKPGYLNMELTGAFDPVNDRFMIRGQVGLGNWTGTWVYNPNTSVWSYMTPTKVVQGGGTFPTYFDDLAMASAAYNSKDGLIYQFGGRYGYPGVYHNDLFTYNVATNTWTQLQPTADPTYGLPSIRQKSGWAYDSAHNIFLLYGGHNDSGLATPPDPLNDTWLYNPTTNAWTKLLPSTSPTNLNNAAGGLGAFERLAYDESANAFILTVKGSGGYTDGAGQSYQMQTWFFRYSGIGPDPGYATASYSAPSGSINNHATGWAKTPQLAANGTDLYAGWVETGDMWDTTDEYLSHPYVKKFSGSSWSSLTSWNTLDSTYSGHLESYEPSLAYVGSDLWVSYYSWNDTSGQNWAVFAKKWNGTSWSGGTIGAVNTGSTWTQTKSQITNVNGTPHVAFIENVKNGTPYKTFVYVKYWDGSAWQLKGSTFLNNDVSTRTVAESLSIGSDGTNPWVAWTEYTIGADQTDAVNTRPKLYVKQWNGSAWANVGTELNVDTTNGMAFNVAIKFIGTQPYVAWTERTATGPMKLYVKTYSAGSWSLVGSGAINRDGTTGWAFWPSVDTDGTNLFVGWAEQQAIGQKPKAYVSKWNGSAWSALGSALNADSTGGSAQRVSVAVYGSQPVAAWGEVSYGTTRQVYGKTWNGTTWYTLGGAAPIAPTITASSPLTAGTQGSAYTNTLTATGDTPITWAVTTGTLPTGLSLSSGGLISGTPSGAGTSTFSVTATNATGSDTKSLSLTINAASPSAGTRMQGRLKGRIK